VRQDAREAFTEALERARVAAYPPGEFVGQENLMRASEIRALAVQAGVGPGVSVLDLCCGVAGPGRFITAELRCGYLGVDAVAGAIAIARELAEGLPCRFEVARIPPLPRGPFDVVLLLETILAFPDKRPLLAAVAAALAPGGRFAFTLEEGDPLTPAEQAAMPDSDTVWLTPLDELRGMVEEAGLVLRMQEDHTPAHAAMAEALRDAFLADADAIAEVIGRPALDVLLDSHRLWSSWMARGRVRKFALVAEKP
jgi:SAM-dependent methyltransferase